MSRLRSGAKLSTVASSFAASSEFKRTYGSLSNTAYVDRVYRNVLGRGADPKGRAYWLAKLGAGTSRGAVMTSFSESSENIRKTTHAVDVVTITFVMLGRATPSSELDSSVARLASGAPRTDLIAEILRTGEYAARIGAPPITMR